MIKIDLTIEQAKAVYESLDLACDHDCLSMVNDLDAEDLEDIGKIHPAKELRNTLSEKLEELHWGRK